MSKPPVLSTEGRAALNQECINEINVLEKAKVINKVKARHLRTLCARNKVDVLTVAEEAIASLVDSVDRRDVEQSRRVRDLAFQFREVKEASIVVNPTSCMALVKGTVIDLAY